MSESIHNQPAALTDVLMWDAIEREWRIGHIRMVLEGVEPFWCACSVNEAADLLMDGNPVPVFEDVGGWAHLPASLG